MDYEDLDYSTLLALLVNLTEQYSKAINNPVLGNEFPVLKSDIDRLLVEIKKRKSLEKKQH